MALKLTVNGEVRCLDPEPIPPTLEAVISALGYNPQLVVAEHSGVITPRSQWTSTTVDEGDNLEIVTIVGGGS